MGLLGPSAITVLTGLYPCCSVDLVVHGEAIEGQSLSEVLD